MKEFVKTIILIMVLTVVILYSYGLLQGKISGTDIREFYSFLNGEDHTQEGKNSIIKDFEKKWKALFAKDKQETDTAKKEESEGASNTEYRGVWLSYQEFNAYRNSVTKNNASSFRKFFDSVIKRCKELNFNRIIVQVRPYGDALYPSDYFPWAACISGSQGKDPGYDPLEIMVERAHKSNIKIEAWINPYRISSGNIIDSLSKKNQARIWANSPEEELSRNVLEYEGALYYNPSSQKVQNLIVKGVEEIVKNYEVDGIHMDDYFYPSFTEDNVESEFDAPEYKSYLKKNGDSGLSIAQWRRENVNHLVSALYETVHQQDENITFGISPAGNLDNLRSPLEYYVDIDTWMTTEGYVDYIMPQIYWGFSNTQAPFEEVLEEWCSLEKDALTDLYIGLQMYRLGTEDKSQSDYEELQEEEYLKKQIKAVESNDLIKGYCVFSYQYLVSQKDDYQFDCMEFSAARRKLLLKNAECLAR